MKRRTWVTMLVLSLSVVVIVAMLFREAGRGPVFRAEDHADLRECLLNVPAEWEPGSLERMGAEAACRYVHQPPARQ